MKEESITMKKTTIWQITTGVLAVLLVVSIFTGGFGGGNANVANNNDNNAGSNDIIPTGVANVNAEEYVDEDLF